MNCPVCGDKMKEVVKCGVELDICPACKGVWLDRGELEKLMEYAAANGASASAPQETPPPLPEAGRNDRPTPYHEYREPYRHGDHDDHDDDDDHHYRHDDHHWRQGHEDSRGQGYGYGGQHNQYPKKKSWVSNLFDMLGD